MKRILFALLALALVSPMAEMAFAEHPEHPSSGSSKRRSYKKKKKKKSKWVQSKAIMRRFVSSVEDHINLVEEEEGSFQVYDKKLKKTWELKLDRIHKKRIARLGRHEFFACADFDEVDGENRLDLDFFVRWDGEDGWDVSEVLVHKVNGKPRYTYNKKNERVPVKGAKKKKRKKKRKKRSLKKMKSLEHPEHPEHPASGGSSGGGGNEHPEHPS